LPTPTPSSTPTGPGGCRRSSRGRNDPGIPQNLLPSLVALAVLDSIRGRLALEIVPEPLQLPNMVVPRRVAGRAVVLPLVDKEYHLLPQAAAEIVQLHALEVVHVPVRVPFLEQQRDL